jgi:hypothetical protein
MSNSFSCIDDNVPNALRVNCNDIPPPKNFRDLASHPEAEKYFRAFLKELEAFKRSKSIEVPIDINIHDIPPEMILQLMPIFTKKYEGLDFSKFKCRMVVLGNHWKNIHNMPVYSDMIDMDTLKVLIGVAAAADWELFKIDVAEAFLTTRVNKERKKRHTGISEPPDATYYVRRPPGLTNNHMPYISKANSFIYGHPLAMREFNQDIKEMFISNGYSISNYCSNVYYKHDEKGSRVAGHAVDDLPMMCSSEELKHEMLQMIQESYPHHTTEDPVTIILGMTISRDRKAKMVTLKQEAAVIDTLQHLPDWTTIPLEQLPQLPLPPPPRKLSKHDQYLMSQPLSAEQLTLYQSKIGMLNWLTHTIPDILPAQRLKARRSSSPNELDMKHVDHIIKHVAYLQRTQSHGLTIGSDNGVQLIGTVDTSYAPSDVHSNDLRSITGGTIHLSGTTGSMISICTRHDYTTDSSMAAEGVGAHLLVKRILPLRVFLTELGFPQHQPTMIFMDNEPFLKSITGDKGPSNKSKHIMIKLHITKEAYEAGEIEFAHMDTANIPSDALTKLLAQKEYNYKRTFVNGSRPMIMISKLKVQHQNKL